MPLHYLVLTRSSDSTATAAGNQLPREIITKHLHNLQILSAAHDAKRSRCGTRCWPVCQLPTPALTPFGSTLSRKRRRAGWSGAL
ncbi:MAG: hypothetical protein GPOALKHO_000239 [Sodalis sp.]|nr:MAG: hypothetical protein GPOALKHO_000239 [Sodalis sp.]